MNVGQVNKVVITCPIRRLGSLMDVSPVLAGLAKHFSGRIVLGPMGPYAEHLWRHLISKLVKNGDAVRFEDLLQMEQSQLKSDESVIGIPLGDDSERSVYSYNLLDEITAAKSFRIGLDRMSAAVFKYFNQDEDHTHPRLWLKADYFDRVIRSRDGTFPEPAYLNGQVEIVRAAVKEAGLKDPFTLAAKPVIWTGSKEVGFAEEYFKQRALVTEKTIGLHLTAGTYDVSREIWPDKNFVAVAKHFIERGYEILLVTGSLAVHPKPLALHEDWQLHRAFKATLDTIYGSSVHKHAVHHFHGDVLEGAEVIRRCGVFFSAETGPAHIASAVGTPKVTIANNTRQARIWMLTGEQDVGFVSRRQGDNIIGPSVALVIEAVEKGLSFSRS